jgi:DNA recombination protein RmuC
MQEFLKDETGQMIKDESGKKLQPDVVLKYPDNRKVIIDSKVSLVAYEKFCSTEDIQVQNKALDDHLISVRGHIDNLSSKNYQNFAPTLDFVMLFVPIEPAYLIAMQKDPNLWNYAYKKRILLISPTNLIAALKLISDLWQREDQNQNAKEIADRGGKLYDKFVNFVSSLSNVGTHIERTQKSYDDAMKQLKTGSGNLVGQAQKLKELKVDAKKEIPQAIIDDIDLSDDN